MEIWKDVIDYEGLYKVSNLGNVKSLKYKGGNVAKILNPSINSDRYLTVKLYKFGIKKTTKVHILVAMSFIDNEYRNNDLVVNHINHTRTDNRLDNLEIITNRENTNKKHIKSSSQYTGVSWCKIKNKWRSSIQIKGKHKHLGYFNNEIDASNAYQNELKSIVL